MTNKLLYAREVPILEHVSIQIPLLGDILDKEEHYYSLVSRLTATPIDYMVQLDDVGVDFSTINDYDLFLMLFPSLVEEDTSMIFGDLDLGRFKPEVDPKTKMIALVHQDNGTVLSRGVHAEIARTLRTINNLVRDNRKAGNEEARKFLIERARAKQARAARRNRKKGSDLEAQIISLVNSSEFKYDFDSVRNLTIYQFNACFRQVVKRVSFDDLMIGVYAGTVNTKEMSSEKLSWMYTHENQ